MRTANMRKRETCFLYKNHKSAIPNSQTWSPTILISAHFFKWDKTIPAFSFQLLPCSKFILNR